MDEHFTIEKLKELLNGSAERLQKLPELKAVDPDTRILFDRLAQEYNYMFSYIIDFLNQDQ